MFAKSPSPSPERSGRWFLVLLVLLAVTLATLFSRSFRPGFALFANDGPLALVMADAFRTPAGFWGIWHDLQWLGSNGGNYLPNVYASMQALLGPLWFINFSPALSLLLLGLSAGLFFRVLGLRTPVCVIAALAVALNSNVFSNVCWGLISRATCFAAFFLAMSAVVTMHRGRPALKALLAGSAIGLSITEAGDNGAILSLYVAAYTVFMAATRGGWKAPVLARSALHIFLMAAMAGVVASQTFNIFFNTSVKGIALHQSSQSSQQKWDWATQWSLPKAETLRVIIPGVFGYRLDTADGGNYWGGVGQQPGWMEHHQGFPRHSGSGEYAGVLVVLLALFAVGQAMRGKKSPFDEFERKLVGFTAVLIALSLAFSWGRHAPFYQLIYSLPYFSTIRNPMKFMHPFHLLLGILFGFGLQALAKTVIERPLAESLSLGERMLGWWRGPREFEHRWVAGCAAAFGAAALGALLYAGSRKGMVEYLASAGFPGEFGEKIFLFSLREVGIFLIYFALAAALLALILSGAFAGRKAVAAWWLLGLFTVVDLARANQPWIMYYDYKDRYASNAVLDILRDKPYEHRVTSLPFNFGEPFASFQQFYNVEWLQHHFPYYNIQALDVAQMSRAPEEFTAYMTTLSAKPTRLWQLTNTRYLFAPAAAVGAINQNLDPVKRRFRVHTLFTLQPKPDNRATAITNSTGPFALMEFTGALPRAALYGRWEASTNDQASLARLVSDDFDPEQTLIIAGAGHDGSTNAPGSAGSVRYTYYDSRTIRLVAEATRPAMLLLNDRYDPNWKLWVDQKPADLLRANFIVRGVELSPGKHEIELRFRPPVVGNYVYLGSMAFSVLLLGILVVGGRSRNPQPALAAGVEARGVASKK